MHLKVEAEGGTLHLAWQATDSTDQAEYNVYRSYTLNGPAERILTTHSTQCDLPLEKLQNQYFFCVTASLNGAAESVCSDRIKVVVPGGDSRK